MATKNAVIHSEELMAQMKFWSKRMGFEIYKSLYFTKATIKDIVNLRMSCGEAVATLKMAEQGNSMLVCMLRLMAATAESRLKDAAAEKLKQPAP